MDDLDLLYTKIKNEITVTDKDVCEYIEKIIQDPPIRLQGLEGWERWLKERINQQTSLGKKIGRKPDKLIMNMEKPTDIKHKLSLLEDALAKNVHVFDKRRGHPNFWLTIENVSGKKHKDSITKYMYPGTIDFSIYKSTATNYGYYGIPKKLDKEKGLTGEYRQLDKVKKFYENPFVKKSLLEGEINLKTMFPHKPDIQELFIKGKNLETKQAEKIQMPKIIISEPTKVEDSTGICGWWLNDMDPHSVSPPILQIGKQLVTTGVTATNFIWSLSFCYKCKLNDQKLNIKKVKMTNIGNTVVHFKWKKIPTYINKKLPFKFILNDEPKFFFDISDGLILPGNSITFLFLFKTRLAGSYKEVWQLITKPPVHNSPLLFVLKGLSLKETNRNIIPAHKIDAYIKECTIKAKIAYKINKQKLALHKKQYDKLIKYNEMFTEREKFQYNNPTLYYSMHEVNILKAIYFKITQSFWNYSFNDLKQAICSMIDKEQREKYLTTYVECYRSLQRPPVFDHVMNNRYNGVYALLCRFANEVEAVFIGLEVVYNLKPLPRVDMLYEKMEPIIPTMLNESDVICVEDSEDSEEVEAFDALIKDYFIKDQGVDTITYKPPKKDGGDGAVEDVDDDDADDGDDDDDDDDEDDDDEEEEEEEEEEVEEEEDFDDEDDEEEEEVAGEYDEEVGGEMEGIEEEEETFEEDEEESSDSEELGDRGSSEDEDSVEGLEHAESQSELSRTDLIRDRELNDMATLEGYRKLNDAKPYLANKKFINYIGLKNFQRKIKHKVCRNRINFRHILSAQCKLILEDTIDKIASFLEATQLVEDDVQLVQNPLYGTYPYY